jgi:hypothetical protein
MDRPHFEDVVDQLWPLHGPYGPDATALAVKTADQLIRYLNYATQHAEAMPWPGTAYDLVGTLKTTADKLPQLLDQTGRRVGELAQMPECADFTMPYHREPEPAHDHAVALVDQARAELDRAAALARELSAALAAAQNLLSPVGLNIDPEDEDK